MPHSPSVPCPYCDGTGEIRRPATGPAWHKTTPPVTRCSVCIGSGLVRIEAA